MRETEQNSIDLVRSEAEKIFQLINACNIDNEILHEYDASAIYVELSRKEARENLTDDLSLFEKFFSISTDINNMAGLINSGGNYEMTRRKLEDFQFQIDKLDGNLALTKYVQQWYLSVHGSKINTINN